MEKNVSLLMTETSPELCQLCKETLPEYNIDVTVCESNGNAAYQEIVRLKPDAVLLDAFMPEMDAIALKEKFAENFPKAKTLFYVTGTFQNEDYERDVMESGFSYYFLKPFDVSVLAQRINQNFHRNGRGGMPGEESMITDMLRAIGVPAHIKGYRFLRDAIMKVIDRPELISAVTKELYPEIASEHDTTASRVERAIRHAIEVAWDRGDIETLNYYFGSTVNSLRGKPTNSEFIAMLADRVDMAHKQQSMG